MDNLKKLIREVPDFPKAGINFYDITTLLKHPQGLRETVDALAAEFEGTKVDTVIGVEARGFIFAPALAYHLGAGFVPVRKPRKLPAVCVYLLRSRIRPGYAEFTRCDRQLTRVSFRRLLVLGNLPSGVTCESWVERLRSGVRRGVGILPGRKKLEVMTCVLDSSS